MKKRALWSGRHFSRVLGLHLSEPTETMAFWVDGLYENSMAGDVSTATRTLRFSLRASVCAVWDENCAAAASKMTAIISHSRQRSIIFLVL